MSVLNPSKPELSPYDVHVWRASLSVGAGLLGELERTLTGDEISRARRFVFPRDRDRFIAARGILRDILARYCDADPVSVRFQYGSAGKPSLARDSGPPDLRFNVSHSHGLALVAVTRAREIGVDLELVRPEIARERIAERFFSPSEATVLRSLPEDLQAAAFFRCWTRKEAYIKACGEGLSIPLDSFDVTLAPGEPARLIEVRGGLAEPGAWSIADIDPGSEFEGAVAAEGSGWRIELLDWSPAVR